jgi:hypothetical protein
MRNILRHDMEFFPVSTFYVQERKIENFIWSKPI